MCRSQYVEMNDALMRDAWVPCTALSQLSSYNGQEQPVWLRVCTAINGKFLKNERTHKDQMSSVCSPLCVLVRWDLRGLGLQPPFSSIWPMMEKCRTLDSSARKLCLSNSVTLMAKTTYLVHFIDHLFT